MAAGVRLDHPPPLLLLRRSARIFFPSQHHLHHARRVLFLRQCALARHPRLGPRHDHWRGEGGCCAGAPGVCSAPRCRQHLLYGHPSSILAQGVAAWKDLTYDPVRLFSISPLVLRIQPPLLHRGPLPLLSARLFAPPLCGASSRSPTRGCSSPTCSRRCTRCTSTSSRSARR